MKKKKFFLFLFILFGIFLINLNFISAQGKKLEINYPILPGVEIPATVETAFPVYIRYIFNLAIISAGIIALGAFIVGGFRYLTSGGSPSSQKDASGQIAAGFFSLIILLSSYLILVTIDPQLVVFSTPNIEKIAPVEVEPIPPEKIIYNYEEIPAGYFIDEALEQEKLDKIASSSKQLMEKVSDLKKLADELKKLTDQCQCQRTLPVNASGDACQSCTHSQPCPCTGCQGEFLSNHDPCPKRDKIEEKKKEILKKVEEIKELRGKLEEQKQILIKDLANLEKAEKLMVECFGQAISYDNLVGLKNILNIEIKKNEEWESLTIPADEATFYCQK